MWKDRKPFCPDLKHVYGAPTRAAATDAFHAFAIKLQGKYRHAIQSWTTNWEGLTHYFEFPLEIRNIIYTTNFFENLNRRIRKYTKTKVQFPNDQAAEKAVSLAIMNIEKAWSRSIKHRGLIIQQFLTIFEDRCRIT